MRTPEIETDNEWLPADWNFLARSASFSLSLTDHNMFDGFELNPPPNTWRGLIENGILLGLSTANYWRKYSQFIADWQYELNWEDQKHRFFTFEANRFDSNNFRLNWLHAFSGALYYHIGRTNNWTVGQSSLLTILSSLFWEYVTEWREIISINDNFFSCLGGIAVGENLFQWSQYVCGQTHWLPRTFAWLVFPIASGNRWLDRRHHYRYPTPSKDYWHMQIGLNQSLTDDQRPVSHYWHIGFDYQFSYFQEALESENRIVILPSVSLARTMAMFRLQGKKLEDVGFFIKTGFGGRWNRWALNRVDGGMGGFYSWFGWAGAMDFFQRRAVAAYDSLHDVYMDDWEQHVTLPTKFLDKWAILDLIGPQYQWQGFLPFMTVTSQAGFYISFSMINAYALNDYSRFYPIKDSKTTLKNYGYYYAYGYSAEWSLTLQSHLFSFFQDLRYHYCRSFDSRDRYGEVKDNFPILDSRFIGRWVLAFRFPGLPVGLSLNYDLINRWGRIKTVASRGGETRFYYSLLIYL